MALAKVLIQFPACFVGELPIVENTLHVIIILFCVLTPRRVVA